MQSENLPKIIREWGGAVIMLIVVLCTYLYCFDPKLNLNGDSAAYIELGRNLAEGRGYVTVGSAGVTPTNFYPVGWPFLIACARTLGVESVIGYKIMSGIFMMLSLLIVYTLVYKILKNRDLALVIGVLTAFSPQLMEFASMAMSEMSYLFFTALTFLALWKMSQRTAPNLLRSGWFWCAVGAAAAAYYIRSMGAAAIFAVVIYYLFRREWRGAAVSAVSMVALLIPWAVRNAAQGLESRYLGTVMTVNPWRPEEGQIRSVGELIQKMVNNFDETVVKGFRELLFPFVPVDYQTPSAFGGWVIGLLVLAAVLYGLWQLRSLRWSLMAFMVANIGLFMLWHGGNGSRYVTVLIPFLYAGFWTAVYTLVVRYAKVSWKYLPYAFCVTLFYQMRPLEQVAKLANEPYPPQYQYFFEIARNLNQQLPAGTIVCNRKPTLFNYAAPNLIGVYYKYSLDDAELIRDMVRQRVDMVVIDQFGYASTPRYLVPAVQKNSELFQVVWVSPQPETYLLKFDREKAAAKYPDR